MPIRHDPTKRERELEEELSKHRRGERSWTPGEGGLPEPTWGQKLIHWGFIAACAFVVWLIITGGRV